MTPSRFVSSVAAIKLPDVFNPYSDRCVRSDVVDAASVRANTLSAVLAVALKSEVDALWIGRDLGYRGGRRTGLALTDDVHLATHGKRWNLKIDRPTRDTPVSERTASVIWNQLNQIPASIFLWNVFPFHPHEVGNAFSNRAHNSKEREVGKEILDNLIELLRPRRIVAIGNDAASALQSFQSFVPITKVRHPSYGGQAEFISQISELYNLPSCTAIKMAPTFW